MRFEIPPDRSIVPQSEIDDAIGLIRAHPDYLEVAAVREIYQNLGLAHICDPMTPDVSDRIRAAVMERRPFSVVRIGDGEANLLSVDGYSGTPALDRYCALKHIGGNADRFQPDETWLLALREMMLGAILQADIIGVIGLWRFGPISGVEAFAEDVRKDLRGGVGYWRAVDYVLRLARLGLFNNKLIASAHLYFGVLENLERLFQVCDRVVLITSRPPALSALQRRNPGIRFSRIAVGQRVEPLPLAPDFLGTVESQLPQDLAGVLCLIGAGPWAEIYCSWVKQRGGVGVDLGSGFDLLAGLITRPVHRRLGLDKENRYSPTES